eukprot:scaffold54268_cov14-Tisochrysis_lutea.AAC.1
MAHKSSKKKLYYQPAAAARSFSMLASPCTLTLDQSRTCGSQGVDAHSHLTAPHKLSLKQDIAQNMSGT